MQIQISKIQARRGLLEDFEGVNLSAGEFGWTMDRRRLFIGNGEVAEGAADVGNTEILTEHTDHLQYIRHRYAGNAPDPITGELTPTANQAWQVPRLLQDRLDDRVSVKSFNVRGDGSVAAADVEAETLNIRRALFELYLKRGFDQTAYVLDPTYFGPWRVLYWPAGVYVINRPLPLLRKTVWIGDGSGRTVIVMRNSDPTYNFTVGSAIFARPEFGYPTDAQLLNETVTGQNFTFNFVVPQSAGNYIGYPVEDIAVSGISFVNDNNGGDVAHITNTINAHFTDCDFIGASYDDSAIRPPDGDPAAMGSIAASAAVVIRSTAVASGYDFQSRRIYFDDCWFGKRGYGIYCGDESLMVNVKNSLFYRCYDGVSVGENLNELGESVTNDGPQAIQVSHSVFNRIRRHSMVVFSPNQGNGSFFNYHFGVGVPQNWSDPNPDPSDADHPIIRFATGTNRNRVFADTFWRDDTSVDVIDDQGNNTILL